MAFTDKEFTYGDTTFRVDKLLPQEAKAVFMAHVRPLLEGALAAESGGGGDGLAMILGIVAKAPQTHYDAVMRALYQHISYTSPDQVQPQRLAGDEERAFANLNMAHILLLDARAFAVNFHESWAVLQSEFPSLSQIIQQLPSETSTLSLPTQ